MKKQIPLELRRTLEDVFNENKQLIKISTDSSSVMEFLDKDLNSDFFFKITEIKISGGNTYYTFSYNPSSSSNLNTLSKTELISNVKAHLEAWLKLLVEFNKPSVLFGDDEILKSYYDELEPIFEILDDDAETSPFSYNQQQKLLAFYDETIDLLKKEENEDNQVQIDGLVSEIHNSKSLITKSTKKEAIKQVRSTLSRIRKFSMQVFEKSLVKFLSDIGKKLISGEIDLTNLLP